MEICRQAGLKCTDVCQCHDCGNRRQRENEQAEEEEGDQSDVDYSDDGEIEGKMNSYLILSLNK